jgi:hypothetical protein
MPFAIRSALVPTETLTGAEAEAEAAAATSTATGLEVTTKVETARASRVDSWTIVSNLLD